MAEVNSTRCEGLLQREHMLWSIVSRQRRPQRRVRSGTAHIAMGGQDLRGALPRDDGAEDAHPGDASDVGDHVVQLQIHLHQRLLHVLNMRGRVLNEALTQP